MKSKEIVRILYGVIDLCREDCECNDPVDGHDYWAKSGIEDHPIEDWRTEILENNTRLGYWAWVRKRMDEN